MKFIFNRRPQLYEFETLLRLLKIFRTEKDLEYLCLFPIEIIINHFFIAITSLLIYSNKYMHYPIMTLQNRLNKQL